MSNAASAKFDPRTDIAVPKAPAVRGDYIPGLCAKDSLTQIIKDARWAFGISQDATFGLVGAKDGRIYFQVQGDSTPYSFAVTEQHLPALSFVVLRKRAAAPFLAAIVGRVYA